jgi:hypothetical protein
MPPSEGEAKNTSKSDDFVRYIIVCSLQAKTAEVSGKAIKTQQPFVRQVTMLLFRSACSVDKNVIVAIYDSRRATAKNVFGRQLSHFLKKMNATYSTMLYIYIC